MSLSTSHYITTIHDRAHRSYLAKFRCGTLPLEIELGRFKKPKTPLNQRICKYCNCSSVEDETHFLIDCTLYSDLRVTLFSHITSINPEFNQLSSVDKGIYIMNCDNFSNNVAALIQLCLDVGHNRPKLARR